MTAFFSLILKPFENGHAHAGMLFISLVTGAVMLFLFKLTSNQQAMKEIKNKISAYFLEMRLYKDDISTVMASQRRILSTNLQYMKLAIVPAVVMIVPVVLIMIQLNLRYSHRGLDIGEVAIVKAHVAQGVDILQHRISLTTPEGIVKASPAVRIPSLGEIDWKIKLVKQGNHDLIISDGTRQITVPIYATSRTIPIYAKFSKPSLAETIFNPGSPRLPCESLLASIEVSYPEMKFDWGFISLSWLWSFLIISMAFGVVLKFLFKVE